MGWEAGEGGEGDGSVGVAGGEGGEGEGHQEGGGDSCELWEGVLGGEEGG